MDTVTNKYKRLDLGTIEAVVNKLGGMEGVERFLRDELVVSEPERRWREKDGVIYFTLPATEGITGEEWIRHLERQGLRVSDWAKKVLRSPEFKPTTGVVYNIAVLKGELFKDSDRYTDKICAEAEDRGFSIPNAEVACLIRETFSDEELKEMGLWWITTMHEPIEDSGGRPGLLYADRYGDGGWLFAYFDGPGGRWGRDGGFAFAVPQVSSQS